MGLNKAGTLALFKTIFILALFLAFLIEFGLPSLQQYLAAGILVSVAEKRMENVTAPTITVCALNPHTGLGWRNLSLVQSYYEAACGDLEGDNLMNCLKESTYEMEDFMDIESYQTYLNFSASFDVTVASLGRCYSMHSGMSIGSTTYDNSIGVPLKRGLAYKLFIHDLNYFLLSKNPKAVPVASIDIASDIGHYSSMFLSIEIILHQKKNLESRPCRSDEHYDLSTCISFAGEHQVGCRLPWNQQRFSQPWNLRESCTNITQYRHHEELWENASRMEIKNVLSWTGCQLPCSYREINIVGSPLLSTATEALNATDFFVGLTLVSTDLR